MKASINKRRRNVKALSPIFAVLILIAIAVIAGIIVYMFTSGYLGTMMGGGTAGQEKVAIEAVQGNGTTVTAWAKSTGGGPVTIQEAILKDSAGSVVQVVTTVTNGLLAANGALGTVTCTFSSMSAGNLYTVTLVSKEGNQFVSPTFKAS